MRALYEALPYPSRDPADERQRLITGSPSHLDEVNHYVFAGRLDFARPFRALVAGGGTGDAAIMLAQQLADRAPQGEVVYLDMSQASRAVAEARAAERGLRNIRFVQGSLLDVSQLAPGPFDYIDCCGVLHHLPDPAKGLAALASVLRPGGGMGLMLYGALGRTGVYPVQEALRLLLPEGTMAERVAATRRLVDALPDTNWLKRNPHLSSVTADDAALADLLLHPIDRAYRVGGIAALVADAGLTLTGFLPPLRYDPLTYLPDDAMRERAAALSWIDACALAESLSGNLKTHVFYVVKARTRAQALALPSPRSIPVLVRQDAGTLARAFGRKPRISANLDGIPLDLDVGEQAAQIMDAMDGRRTLAELRRATALPPPVFEPAFATLYRVLNGLNLMLLRTAP